MDELGPGLDESLVTAADQYRAPRLSFGGHNALEQVSTFRAKGIQVQACLDYASKEDVGDGNVERLREAERILGEKDTQFRIFVVDDEQVIANTSARILQMQGSMRLLLATQDLFWNPVGRHLRIWSFRTSLCLRWTVLSSRVI